MHKPKPNKGYRLLDHTADTALEMFAPSEEELLLVGALAVVDLLTENQAYHGTNIEKRLLKIEALDREDRLVQWLNEVLVNAICHGFLLQKAKVELQGETGLQAEVEGYTDAFDAIATELKSVTYHDLVLELTPGFCRAQVIIDV